MRPVPDNLKKYLYRINPRIELAVEFNTVLAEDAANTKLEWEAGTQTPAASFFDTPPPGAFADGTLKLEASTADIGESQIELPIAYDGESITLTMDHRYVADFCRVLDSESNFVMEIESGASPALLTTDDGYGYVIMPMARDR